MLKTKQRIYFNKLISTSHLFPGEGFKNSDDSWMHALEEIFTVNYLFKIDRVPIKIVNFSVCEAFASF